MRVNPATPLGVRLWARFFAQKPRHTLSIAAFLGFKARPNPSRSCLPLLSRGTPISVASSFPILTIFTGREGAIAGTPACAPRMASICYPTGTHERTGSAFLTSPCPPLAHRLMSSGVRGLSPCRDTMRVCGTTSPANLIELAPYTAATPDRGLTSPPECVLNNEAGGRGCFWGSPVRCPGNQLNS
jgi:hypothetical protein